MMWHEARKQEKKIRGLMVDYQKRADRRRQHYEQIKQDPTQFLRVPGRSLKIHWDQAVSLAAEGPQSMQPWQGNAEIMIDRFDVRAHLDYYPDTVPANNELTGDDENEARHGAYEAYRILVQNACAGITEEQHLQQIHIDELFGAQDKKEEDKKKEKKAAIGFSYDDSTTPVKEKAEVKDEEEEDEEDLEDMDLDNVLDLEKMTDEQAAILNQIGVEYGMKGDDFERFVNQDLDEVEQIRLARILEEEKAQFSVSA